MESVFPMKCHCFHKLKGFYSTIPLKGGLAVGTVYSNVMYIDVLPKSKECSNKCCFSYFFLFIKES